MSSIIQAQQFPYINSEGFSIKDNICHSLIEATYCHNFSNDFLISMMNYLANNEQIKGDFIIDSLFMKYLKSYKRNVEISEKKNLIDSLFRDGQIISQYHFAFICFCDADMQDIYRSKFISESMKLNTEEIISIDGINISYTIFSYLIEKITIPENVKILRNLYYIKKTENCLDYIKILKNVKQYYSLNFWVSINIPYNITIDVKNNAFIFHAAACLKWYHKFIKIQYDIQKLQFPESLNLDLLKKTKYFISKISFLEVQLTSIQEKNLCVLIFLLLNDNVSFSQFKSYQNLMSPRSFLILCIFYSYYLHKDFSNLWIPLLSKSINFNNSKDINLAKFFYSNMHPDDFDSIDDNMEYLFYILPKKMYHNKMNGLFKESKAYYGFLKKIFLNGNININGKERIYNNNIKDFARFLENSIEIFPLNIQEQIINMYNINKSSPKIQHALFFIKLSKGEYVNAHEILKHMNEIKFTHKNLQNINFIDIKNLLKYCSENEIKKICDNIELNKMFSQDELIKLYFTLDFYEAKIVIEKNDFLNSSIKSFKTNKYYKINIIYKNQYEQKMYCKLTDWFSTACIKILESSVFILVPNGNSLTINEENSNMNLVFFTGQLIGLAFNNGIKINIKLSSFIWKLLLNQQIDLEDMKDYDSSLYNLLYYISNNDPQSLNLTFINHIDKDELCKNGGSIKVTNNNKNKYIKLMLKNVFIKKKEKSFQYLQKGFADSVMYDMVKYINFDTFKNTVCNEENIDFSSILHKSNNDISNANNVDKNIDLNSSNLNDINQSRTAQITTEPIHFTENNDSDILYDCLYNTFQNDFLLIISSVILLTIMFQLIKGY